MAKTINSYTWEGPGGIRSLRFIVIQFGNRLEIIDTSIKPFSDGVVYTETFSFTEPPVFSFTVVDGDLIVATGQPEIISYSYDGASVSKSTGRLKIRDTFGVEDLFNGEDLTEGQGLAVRPVSITDNHVYNLRNQTWAEVKLRANVGGREDPITRFRSYSRSRS